MDQQSKPNILLITTDQQRFDTLGSHAPRWLRTPHLDNLAREGITFDRAYTDNPLCVPTRVSIMSGKSVWRHRMLNNGETSDALGHEGTMPALIREAGYQAVAICKMHFGPERARHGFDEIILPADYYREMRDRGLPLQPMRHGLGQNELYPGMATVPESLTLTAWLCDQAALFISERRDPTRPFFLWLSFSKPHPPLDPPEPYYSMYRNSPIPKPAIGDWASDEASPHAVNRLRHKDSYDLLSPEIIHEARSAYYGLITQIDYNLGRTFAALQDNGLLRETFIMFASDHGEFIGDHRLGNKIMFHEASARVPLLIRPPRSWKTCERGTVISSLATHADILPTLVRVAGGAVPEDRDGRDLMKLARGDNSDERQYIEAVSAGADADSEAAWYFGITDGRWKYIWYPEGGSEQLFNLVEDPLECCNLAGDPRCTSEKVHLRNALLEKCRAETADLLEAGELPSQPVTDQSVAERRTHGWPGYHTEHFRLDVRH